MRSRQKVNEIDTDDDGNFTDTDEVLYYTQDANYNVTGLIDTSGTVRERYVYDPYGKVTIYNGDWTSTVSWANSKQNEVLYCGYRWDPETGPSQVRYRPLHPTLGRWTSRDPAGRINGDNRYSYCRQSPTVCSDPLGLWLIKRDSNKYRAVAEAEKGDTIDGLARKIKLETSEFKLWMKLTKPLITTIGDEGFRVVSLSLLTASARICPGEKVTIPNRVVVVYGQHQNWLDLVSWITSYRTMIRMANGFENQSRAMNYRVVVMHGPTAKEVESQLGKDDLYNFIFAGHGVLGSITLRDRPSYEYLISGKYVHHRLFFFALFSCQTAEPYGVQSRFDPATTGGRTDVSAWERNVSSRGWFVGYSGNVTLVTAGFTTVTQGGAAFR